MNALRPPAVPLVVCDPYLSVWSMNDTLTESWSKHWTGKPQTLFGMVRIDGEAYRFMGAQPRYFGRELPAMKQTGLEIFPTRTIYHFEMHEVKLKLSFITPALPYDLGLMSRPVTYLDFQVTAAKKVHKLELYFDIGSDWVVNTPEQGVVWGRQRLENLDLLWMGSKEQAVLQKAGDDLRIDWGYLYTTTSDSSARSVLGPDTATRRHFADTGQLPHSDDLDMPRAVGIRPPMTVAAWAFDLGSLKSKVINKQILIAYDDQFSVEYMHRKLRPYWRNNDSGVAQLITGSLKDFQSIKQACETFDAELMQDLRQTGGEAYMHLAALSFRQCLAAHKLVMDADGTPLFFSKENFSNGCMGTVDVTYPSSPFFLLFNPELLQAQLKPILDYADSSRWPFPFAPHDIGRYPLANGQVYGGAETSEIDQMPVEECGNMLLLVAALCKVRGTVDLAETYWDLLKQWTDYLLEKGLDPEHQLCTDDFAGHLAHNVNLSLKALLAVAAFARLCESSAKPREAKRYRLRAEKMAKDWQKMASDGDHYRLTFDKADTWSQKYNLVWDRLLDLGLFPASVAEKELAYYQTRQQRYGLPLDNRSSYTKLDWIVWSASLSKNQDEFKTFIEPLYVWLNETSSRVPLTDWFYTDNGKQVGFQARSVVGGVFIKMLEDATLWKKWKTYKA